MARKQKTMKTSDLVGDGKPFATQTELANALGITQGAVAKWGGQVPQLREFQVRSVLAQRK